MQFFTRLLLCFSLIVLLSYVALLSGVSSLDMPHVASSAIHAAVHTAEHVFEDEPEEVYSEHQQSLFIDDIGENKRRLQNYLRDVDAGFAELPERATPDLVWAAFHKSTTKDVVPWDREYAGNLWAPIRKDESIFVSIASYRDESCPDTLVSMYHEALHPERIFVGLVQQNCLEDCKTGVLEGGQVRDADPDPDCYAHFCKSEMGQKYCGQVRNFLVPEPESLGPTGARYLASKLWFGEQYFMQIDAHMDFGKNWDAYLVEDMKRAPTRKAVLSHYPPIANPAQPWTKQGTYRMCGATFSESPIEYNIVRIDASAERESGPVQYPLYAPYVAAGFFMTHSSFLRDIPFDPLLPYVFMGEELMLTLRFWTWGWDIFSPSRNVLGHWYTRRHKPKFWETVNRRFRLPNFHNKFTNIMIHRPKHIAGYPESAADKVTVESALSDLDIYGAGPERSVEEFLEHVGLDVVAKKASKLHWCELGMPPDSRNEPERGRRVYDGSEAGIQKRRQQRKRKHLRGDKT
uniref:Glycosyltransferase 2-like domain-containing protein n=1 Tax=Phaeomonas parva TaxID=124430 RepID=A0A6U4ERP7_9STRA|mmetsp:Transcript_22217/g.68417  ORF Transcript_22217/g.68417 Transcript_22217/m.68417 type:complete len:518 (+) Transcript_22217:235-1788(+)